MSFFFENLKRGTELAEWLLDYCNHATGDDALMALLMKFPREPETPEIIKVLIRLGFDVNKPGFLSHTPFLAACRGTSVEALKVMLPHAADDALALGKCPYDDDEMEPEVIKLIEAEQARREDAAPTGGKKRKTG